MTFIVQIRDSWPSVTGQCLYHWTTNGSLFGKPWGVVGISCFLQVLKWSVMLIIRLLILDKHKMNSIVAWKTTTTKNLYALSDLETVWSISRSSQQNRMLLEHIKAHAIYRRMNDVEKSSLVVPRSKRVSCSWWLSWFNVLQQIVGSYNNILNNNLNDNLTTNHLWSLVGGFS